jgi:hypothetical protein
MPAVHGIPRATHDIDVVIAPTAQQLETLIRDFAQSDYYAELEDALQVLRYQSQFNVIDERGVWKIGLHHSKGSSLQHRRICPQTTDDDPRYSGLRGHGGRPADRKARVGQDGRIRRQLRDASGIIAIQGEHLDTPYVERWVAALSLEDQWERAKSLAGLLHAEAGAYMVACRPRAAYYYPRDSVRGARIFGRRRRHQNIAPGFNRRLQPGGKCVAENRARVNGRQIREPPSCGSRSAVWCR